MTEAFYGKPWMWCIIQNFGGTVSLHGALPRMADDLSAAMTSPQRGRLSGLGLIFEGRDYNPVVQDFVTDMTWRRTVPGLDAWLPRVCPSPLRPHDARDVEEAWQMLRQTVYQQVGRADTLLVAAPEPGQPSWGSGDAAYESAGWRRRAEKLLAAADALGGAGHLPVRVVNVTRQVLGTSPRTSATVAVAIQRRDRDALDRAGRDLLELTGDLDELLATRPEFLLGRWLEDAKRWADTAEERRLYERNARNIITLWGPRDSMLHEYASRQWSGMFRSFYRPRWEKYLERPAAPRWTPRSRSTRRGWRQELRAWEERWTTGPRSFPPRRRATRSPPPGALLAKYQPAIRKSLEPEAPSLTTGKPVSCSTRCRPYPARLANDGRRGQHGAVLGHRCERRQGRVVAGGLRASRPPWAASWSSAISATPGYYGFTVEVSTDGQRWELVADRRDNKEPSTRRGLHLRFPPRPSPLPPRHSNPQLRQHRPAPGRGDGLSNNELCFAIVVARHLGGIINPLIVRAWPGGLRPFCS